MSRPRFLITGAAGFIGSHLYARLTPAHAVGTYHHRPIPGGVHFDAASMSLSEVVLQRYPGVTHAFLLHGIGKLDECARDPLGTAKVNVDGTNRMVDELSARGVKIIFPSSDAVFDGTRGSWTEEDSPNPTLTYGKQKAAVERHLMDKPEPWIIARLSKVVGRDPGDHSLFGEWIRRIETGEPIRCARDLVFTPIHVEDVVSALIAVAEGASSGIFNVCGPRSMTRLELLEIFIEAVRQHRKVNADVIPCSIREIGFLEPRPLNQSMVPARLFSDVSAQYEEMESLCRRIAADVFGRNS